MNKKPEMRTQIHRRQALQYTLGLMAAAAMDTGMLKGWTPQAHPEHDRPNEGSKRRPLAEGNPTFFQAGEFQTLTRMVDLIIPRTDTPSAADAGVPLYIDIVVNSDQALGEKIRNGLRELDAASRKASKKMFVDAPEATQIKVLHSLLPKKARGNDFFETVKAMTIVGYYSSEIGLYEELHFKGNEALSNFPGCPHGGHAVDLPARRAGVVSLSENSARKWPFPSSDNITGEDL